MGRLVEGNLLTMQELEAYRFNILAKYQKYLISQLKKLPKSNPTSGIIDIGFECEGWFVDDFGKPVPKFKEAKSLINDLGRELLQCQWEVKNERNNLLIPGMPFEQFRNIIAGCFEPLQKVARNINTNLLLIGGHPFFSAEEANKMITDSQRHRKLIQYVDSYDTNSFIVPFLTGDEKRQGMIYEGFTTSTQITIRVHPTFAKWYHDSYYCISPILLAFTAFSPMIEGFQTNLDSTRIGLVGSSVYGFSEEDQKLGRPGRWGALPPLTEGELSSWGSSDLYDALKKGTDESIARHFAEVMGKEQGHLLITDIDLENDVDQGFPSPISWPYVKFQPFGMNEFGILLELRLIEQTRKSNELPKLILFVVAFLEVACQEMQQGNLRAHSVADFYHNLNLMSQKDIWLKNPTIKWNGEDKKAKEILLDYIPKMKKWLDEKGHAPFSTEILNTFLPMAGLKYCNGIISEVALSLTAAQELRKKAMECDATGINGYEKCRKILENYIF